jgi:hypothetical protein
MWFGLRAKAWTTRGGKIPKVKRLFRSIVVPTARRYGNGKEPHHIGDGQKSPASLWFGGAGQPVVVVCAPGVEKKLTHPESSG